MCTRELLVLLALTQIFLLPSSWARSLGTCWTACAVFDEVVAQAKDDPALQDTALQFLRMVAEARTEEISSELVARFHISPRHIVPEEMKHPDVRARVYERIGRLASEDARLYLEGISKESLSDDQSEVEHLWDAIRVARHVAQIESLPDPQHRAEYLAAILRAKRENVHAWAPKDWAEAELCRSGSLAFLPDVEASIRRWKAPERQDTAIGFCKQIMLVVSSQPDRVAALGSALRLDGTKPDNRLLTWVISELDRMHTKEARRVLENFVREAQSKAGPQLLSSALYPQISLAEGFLRRLDP